MLQPHRDDAQNLPTQVLIPEVAVEDEDERINVKALIRSLILYVVPITFIVYGIVHLHDCPAQPMIDYCIIILGCMSLFVHLIDCPHDCSSICKGGRDFWEDCGKMCLNKILLFAIICVFVTLCFWIFSIHPVIKPDQSNLPNYCDRQFYYMTFWGCIVGIIIIGVMTLCAYISRIYYDILGYT